MIDDVDFLIENSEHDSHMIFIDSQKRNYKIFPTPSEYTITFEQPFKNVYAVEILDASLPTVQYTVDSYMSMLYYATAAPSGSFTANLTSTVTEISRSETFAELFEMDAPNTILICLESQLSSYNIITNGTFSNKSVTNVAVQYVKENLSIMMFTYQNPAEVFVFSFNDTQYCISNISSNLPIIAVLSSGNFYIEANLVNADLFDVTYYTFLSITSSVFNQIQSDGNYLVTFQNMRYTMQIGNYDITSLRAQLNIDWNSTSNVNVVSIGTNDGFQGKYHYFSNNLFIFNCSLNQLDNILGFDLYPLNIYPTFYSPLKIGNNPQVFMSVFQNNQYEMIPPGIVNLGGERYLILRCLELEDLLYGSFAYNTITPGIGLFKLEAGQNSTTNLRWDFVTLNKKPIHPIGKLNRLTFRFEMSNGNLYDFKGANHQFLMAIKFYSPTKRTIFKKSILNPNYNPNLIEYMAAKKNIDNRQNSDDEGKIASGEELRPSSLPSFVDEEEEYKYYKKQIEHYDYDSDD